MLKSKSVRPKNVVISKVYSLWNTETKLTVIPAQGDS